MKTITTLASAILLFSSCNSGGLKGKKDNHPEIVGGDSVFYEYGYSDVNGIKMYYEIHGNNPKVLVLIHGGGSTIQTTFGRIIPFLAGDFKIIAVELQAHGHTGDRDSPESFEQDADDVAGLLQNLGISRASFFGFSNGGNTVMQIAIRHAELADKLIIASAFYKRGGMFPGFFDMMEKATLNDMPGTQRTTFLQINPDSSRLLTMFNKDRKRMLGFKDWDDDVLRSIKAPALIIAGDHDVVQTSHTVAMSGLIPDSRLMILPALHGSYLGVMEIPDTGSRLPELTADIIKEFLILK